MKRILSLVLALAMLFCCAVSATAEGEPIKADAVVFGTIGYIPTTDNYATNLIREKYGIDLNVLPVDTGTDESWNIFWASDGYADIIVPYNYTPAMGLIDDDIVRTIEYDWIKEYAPRLYSLLLSVYGSDERILEMITTRGELYCIPYFGVTNSICHVSTIRNDWLANVGLEVPTTIEELTAVMDAFTNGDPDGNGQNDTFAIDGITYGLFNIAATYGTSAALAFWANEDKTEVTTNAVSEEYRTFLRQVHEWYKAGYIDPEFVTDGRGEIRSKFAAGKIGIYADNPWWFELGRGEVGPLQMLCANDPSVDFATALSVFTGMKNEDGEVVVNNLFGTPNGQAAVYFGYKASDELVIAMLKLIDSTVTLYDGTEEDLVAMENRALLHNGPEGEAWEWNEDHTRPQAIEFDGDTAKRQQEWGVYMFPSASAQDLSPMIGREDEWVIGAYEMSKNTNAIARSNNFPTPALSGDLADKLDMVKSSFSSNQYAFILGDKDLDADWDAYVAEITSYGLQDIIDEYLASLQ